jgi:hypothetical protein
MAAKSHACRSAFESHCWLEYGVTNHQIMTLSEAMDPASSLASDGQALETLGNNVDSSFLALDIAVDD